MFRNSNFYLYLLSEIVLLNRFIWGMFQWGSQKQQELFHSDY